MPEIPSSQFTSEARRTISRWSLRGYCVYFRPISAKLIDPKNEHRTVWIGYVEYVNALGKAVQLREEGMNLSGVVARLNSRVPSRPQSKKRKRGWLAPKKI